MNRLEMELITELIIYFEIVYSDFSILKSSKKNCLCFATSI